MGTIRACGYLRRRVLQYCGSEVLLPFTSKVLRANVPTMKSHVQAVKAANKQPNLLATKDTVYMQTLSFSCLCYVPFFASSAPGQLHDRLSSLGQATSEAGEKRGRVLQVATAE